MLTLPYHGQEVRDDRPLGWLDHGYRCYCCGTTLTEAEQAKPLDPHGDRQCDDCAAGYVAHLLPYV